MTHPSARKQDRRGVFQTGSGVELCPGWDTERGDKITASESVEKVLENLVGYKVSLYRTRPSLCFFLGDLLPTPGREGNSDWPVTVTAVLGGAVTGGGVETK